MNAYLDKYLDDKIEFQQDNPKPFGSEAHRRYDKYCHATTKREAFYLGAKAGDIKSDDAAGFLTRGPKRCAKKQTKKGKVKFKVMVGIGYDGGHYIAERFFLGPGVQARRHKSIEEAEVSSKAIDRVLERVQARINQRIMAMKTSSLEDFVTFVKAAVAEEQKASPELCVEKLRYYAKNLLSNPGFTASSLRKLQKDPQISTGLIEIRVLQDTLKKALQGWLKLCKATGLTELSEIVGVDGTDTGRRAANELAREAMADLKKGEHPSDTVVLKALRLWGFHKSTSRQNVLPEGHEWVHSDTLGIIEERKTHSLSISNPCKSHEYFVRLISSWARKRSPNGELPFTTISLNKNYAGRLHRDAGNIGPSVGLAIGSFTGGRLRVWAGDSGKGTRSDVEQVRNEPSVALNIKKGVVFDGNCAHEVEPFKGERYSLIFFTLKKYKKASDAVKRKMVNMGADWPTIASLNGFQAKVPRVSK